MLTRIVKIPKSEHFFLFGARATGKTTLLECIFPKSTTQFFDLLVPAQFERFSLNPTDFQDALNSLPKHITHVVVDEIQRVPELLDVVQHAMNQTNLIFGLTCSSSRKLKRGSANLLGGRAVTRTLYPLSVFELPKSQNCTDSKLHWGGLPLVHLAKSDERKKELLRSYVTTYLAEEIVAEQLVRNLTPFRKFLPVAAQMNGKIINATSIARDIGVSHNTVSSYFEILEDTLVGFRLPAFSTSVRKKLRSKSKFYFVDTGIVRSLNRALDHPLTQGTSHYGDVFEHLVVSELKTLALALKPDWELSFLQTESGTEVDVVIDKGLGLFVLIEIKSTKSLKKVDLTSELKLMSEIKSEKNYVLSQDPLERQLTPCTRALHWIDGIKEIFDIQDQD